MRENPFLGVLALILALGMPLPFELFACVSTVAEGKIFDAEIRTETELFAAVQDPTILGVALKNDIVTTRNLHVSRNIVFDLGGFNITSLKENVCVIDIKYGSVLITGKGSIVAYGLKGTAIRIKGATTSDNENYAEVLIDETIKLFAPNHYGVLVAPNFKAAYGVTVDFRGAMVAQDGFCISGSIRGRGTNIPLIKIADGTKITVDENSGVALHAAGYGRWEIGASEITGATGIVAQAGNLTLTKTKIIATGAYVDAAEAGAADGLTMIGAVIQAGKALNPDHVVEITVNGGEFTSLRSFIFAETRQQKSKPALQMLVIENGDFAGKLGTFYGLAPRGAEHAVTVVYGGNFTENIQDFISSSCHVDKVRDQGIYQVIEDKVAEEIDEATQLARAEGSLEALIEESSTYTNGYAAGDLGKWKPAVTKAIASIKRAVTLGKKALKEHLEFDRIASAEQSLRRALDNLQLVHNTMRTELAESIASVNAIDPRDYTKYSYQQLTTVTAAAEELLQRENVSLKDLYSAILDLEINIDLLDGIDEVPAEELDEMDDLDELFEATNLAAAEPPAAIDAPELVAPNLVMPNLAEPPAPPIMLSPAAPSLPDAPIIAETEMVAPAESIAPESSAPAEPELSAEEIADFTEFLASLCLAQSEIFFADAFAAAADEFAATETASFAEPEPTFFVQNPEPAPVHDAAYIMSHSVEFPAEAALIEAKGNLYAMLEAVQGLTLGDYEINFAEQFGELQVAIAKARAILYKPNVNFVELMSSMDELAEKTTGLKGLANLANQPPQVANANPAPVVERVSRVDWTGLSEVVAEISQLNPNDFTTESYARILAHLETAKSMLVSSDATQSAVEDLVFEINLALLALERAPEAVASPMIESAAIYAPSDPSMSPSWMMSMLAGAYAGMATYRRSRLIAKRQKRSLV